MTAPAPFAGVKMPSVALGAGRHLLVEQGRGDGNLLFFRTQIDAFLNAEQVEELVRRMNVWLEGRRMPPKPTLWEDT